MLVENLPVPFDRRMWQEALTLTSAGYRVSVICPKGGPHTSGHEELSGIHIYRYRPPAETRGTLSYIWEFLYCWAATGVLSLWVFARHGFDTIHAANPPDTFFLLARLYKFLGKRFVYDQHDLCPEVFLARFGRRGILYRLLRFLERESYRTADVVLATNLSYREVALTRGHVAADRCFVVRSAPDRDRFHPAPPDAALRDGWPYLVCYLGVMAPQDGVDYLLRSISHIVHDRRRSDIRFVLIGSGDSFGDLQVLARDLDLDGAVRFTGRIPDDELQRWLSSADICVAPDPKNELNDASTMNKVLEYMAAGRPIVAYDLKETRYSAADGALYATPNDEADFAGKVLELLADPDRRTAMGARNRRRFEDALAWDYTRDELLRAYARLERPAARDRGTDGR